MGVFIYLNGNVVVLYVVVIVVYVFLIVGVVGVSCGCWFSV